MADKTAHLEVGPRSVNGVFTFATSLADLSPYLVTVLTDVSSYAVTVGTQPAGQTCIVTFGSGTLGGDDVTSVVVTCS